MVFYLFIDIMLHYKVILHVPYVEIKYQLDATDDIHCRSYCLLNMFRAPLYPSSGAREYYTDGRCLWYLVLWFLSCRYGVELRVMCPVCRLLAFYFHILTTMHGQNHFKTTCSSYYVLLCNKIRSSEDVTANTTGRRVSFGSCTRIV